MYIIDIVFLTLTMPIYVFKHVSNDLSFLYPLLLNCVLKKTVFKI